MISGADHFHHGPAHDWSARPSLQIYWAVRTQQKFNNTISTITPTNFYPNPGPKMHRRADPISTLDLKCTDEMPGPFIPLQFPPTHLPSCPFSKSKSLNTWTDLLVTNFIWSTISFSWEFCLDSHTYRAQISLMCIWNYLHYCQTILSNQFKSTYPPIYNKLSNIKS